jgi:hypothetical protein
MQVIFKFIAIRLVIISKYVDIINLKVSNYNSTNMLKNKDLGISLQMHLITLPKY